MDRDRVDYFFLKLDGHLANGIPAVDALIATVESYAYVYFAKSDEEPPTVRSSGNYRTILTPLRIFDPTPGIVETDYSEISITCEALRRYIVQQEDSMDKTDTIGRDSKRRAIKVAEGVREKLALYCRSHHKEVDG